VTVDEEEIKGVIARLGRPHASGGLVIGRAAILAEGTDFAAIEAWIIDHGGTPQTPPQSAARGGLHGSQRLLDAGRQAPPQAPQYLLPAGALD
jgi:hypothetical protein